MYTLAILLLIGTAYGQETTTTEEITASTVNSNENKSCIELGEKGVCVPYHLCNETVNYNDGIDLHFQPESCESYLDVCCKVPIKVPEPEEIVQRKGCGWRNPLGDSLLSNKGSETEANFGEFPWVVAIFKVNDNESQYIGSGSLIDPRVVLTVAHRVAKEKTLRIRAGEWDLQTEKEIYPHQDIDVESVSVHKDFNKVLFYDIAILFLSKPVEPAPHIGIACLPQPKILAEAGAKCFTTGWGRGSGQSLQSSRSVLKKAELPVVARKECQNRLRQTRLKSLFELHPSFMCAGGDGVSDTCVPEGGSPLVCPIEFQEGRYVQNGMSAWGVGCGREAPPNVYVDVAVLRDWIDNEVLGKGIENLEYAKY